MEPRRRRRVEGMRTAARLEVAHAPFFVVEDAAGERGVLRASAPSCARCSTRPRRDRRPHRRRRDRRPRAGARGCAPEEVARRALARYGARCRIAFSGAEDVAVVDMAARSRHLQRVLPRHGAAARTLRFIDKVRAHHRIRIDVTFPEFVAVESLVRAKGLFSFLKTATAECCTACARSSPCAGCSPAPARG
ncbi:MAG: hypothetical protein R3A48_26295 [Polyangiales bacterium]